MRPESLYPLFRPVTALSGVGPRLGTLVTRVAGPNLVDLLWTLPHGLIDWRQVSTINTAEPGARVMLELTIGEHQPPRVPSQPYRIRANDQTSFIDLTFFRPKKDYLDKTFPTGATLRVGGRIEIYNDRPQMAHPEKVMTMADAANSSGIDVIYPLTEGLPPKVMAKAAHGAVAQAPQLPEWQNAAWLARNRWPAWHEALHSVHFPQSMAEIDPATPARQRLAYDELLASQLALAIVRGRMRALPGRTVPPAPQLRQQALAALPFTLTPAQEAA
ncbi:MAG TPA: ATP-dependent DNA helicase RecG, partial [Alphaproteobacteria bacterium]|nr:ATP-dependent DNA helicase RecG [Alphaproteobacteria bacterium]